VKIGQRRSLEGCLRSCVAWRIKLIGADLDEYDGDGRVWLVAVDAFVIKVPVQRLEEYGFCGWFDGY
jgi:hypothetical protein